jgi:HEAT repeat protein
MAKSALKKTVKQNTKAPGQRPQTSKNSVVGKARPGNQNRTPGKKNITTIVENKALRAKEKTVKISGLLLDHTVSIDDLVELARSQHTTNKGNLVEAIEHASRCNPEIVNKKTFEFVIQSLKDEGPRVKWEAARVISNTAHLFPGLLKKAVINLLTNTEHSGTVVRWSAASALSKIILLNTALNKELIPAAAAIIEWEQDNAVRKIYQAALKKTAKQL